jgi:hypothetical protein
MRFAAALLFLACGSPPAVQTPTRPETTIEYVVVSPRWVQQFIRTDTDDFRTWAGDPKSAVRIAEIRHILFRGKKDAPDARLAARRKAEGVIVRLETGTDFVSIATSESEDSSKIRGGAVGTDTSKFVEPFRKAADALAPGQHSGVVETDFGFHVILKDPITPETTADAYRKFRGADVAKNLAAEILKRRAGSPTMDLAITNALTALLSTNAASDADRPVARTFDAAMEKDALAACSDRKEQLRRAAARTRETGTLLCGELFQLSRFSQHPSPGATLTLPIPPHEGDPLVAVVR